MQAKQCQNKKERAKSSRGNVEHLEAFEVYFSTAFGSTAHARNFVSGFIEGRQIIFFFCMQRAKKQPATRTS